MALRDPCLDVAALARKKIPHRLAQSRMPKVVHAPRQGGIEPAQPFVFATRTRLEAPNPALDTMLDRRVIAYVEMQELQLLEASPVTPVEHPRLLEVDGSRDQLAVPPCPDKTHVTLEVFADHLEELARQILPPPVELLDGRQVNPVHRREQRVRQLVAGERPHLDALLRKCAPFMAYRVAPFALELSEIIVEGREVGVMPMILIAEPLQEAQSAQRLRFVLRAKIDVRRRKPIVIA